MTSNANGVLELVKPGMVLGYSAAKSRDGRSYVRLDVLCENNPKYGGQGWQTRAVYLPDEELARAVPAILGKVAHCESQQTLVGNPVRSNFTFADE